MFHLAWFVGKGFGLHSWRGTWSSEGVAELLRPHADIDLARALERAGFDYIMFEDSLQIADHFQGSMEQYLRHGIECPRGDPTALVSIVAGDQTHLPHSPPCPPRSNRPSWRRVCSSLSTIYGFFLSMEVDRRTIATIADGLVPALRKRGLVRHAYEHVHFRDNLLAFCGTKRKSPPFLK